MYYVHDHMTIAAWVAYGIALIVYSALIQRKDKTLGFLGISLMSFIVFSSLFFIRTVIDPSSYVGASAVTEIYIINEISVYLVVMYFLEVYRTRQER